MGGRGLEGRVKSSVMSAVLTADHRVIMKFSTYCSVILFLVSSTAPKLKQLFYEIRKETENRHGDYS